MKLKNRYLYYSILPCCLLLLVIGSYALSYKPPTENPPFGNLPAPINASLEEQTKAGNLIIEGNLTTGGFTMLAGAEANKILTTNASGVASWQTPEANSSLWTQTGDDIYYNIGKVGIGTTDPQARLNIVTGRLNLGDDDVSESVNYDRYAGAPYLGSHITLRRARGSILSPSPVVKGDNLMKIGTAGYTPSGWADNPSETAIKAYASEDWTDEHQGVDLAINITPNNNIYGVERLRITNNGNVGIGTASPGEKLEVAGNVKVEGKIYGGTRCPSDMAYIPGDRPFCIDKYEAYNVGGVVANDTCTNGSQAEVDANTTTAVAGSASGQTPLVSINWCAAKKACQNAGKHLCTNTEWFQACNYKGSQWNITTEESAETMSCITTNKCDDAACLTGASPGCVTQEGVYDMIGNVWEWVDKVFTADPTVGFSTHGFITDYDLATALPNATGASNNLYGNDRFVVFPEGTGDAYAMRRGGRWTDGASAGCFLTWMNGIPEMADNSGGFRCCQ